MNIKCKLYLHDYVELPEPYSLNLLKKATKLDRQLHPKGFLSLKQKDLIYIPHVYLDVLSHNRICLRCKKRTYEGDKIILNDIKTFEKRIRAMEYIKR